MTRRLSPGLAASALWLTGLGLVGSGAAVAQPGGARSSAPSASARPLQETALPGPKPGFAPDPPTRASKKHWVFELSVKKGVLDIDKVTSRTLAGLHAKWRVGFVGAPIFARPDGVARKQAFFTVGATDEAAIEQRIRHAVAIKPWGHGLPDGVLPTLRGMSALGG